jgi:hypothetical protein
MPDRDVRIGNYSMAAGRIGVAVILVPLLWGMALLLVFADEPSRFLAVGGGLFALGLVLAWTALRSPLWVAVNDDTFRVGYLLGTRRYDIHDVVDVRSGHMLSTIGGLGTRRYPAATFVLKSGRRIRIQADASAVAAIASKLGRASTPP